MSHITDIKYIILLMSLLVLTTIGVQAKSYNSWHLLYQDTYGVIKKIKDPKRKKTVIEFNSKSSRDTYINGAKTGRKAWNNKKNKTIRWNFNFPKSFVIMVSLKTKKGYRDLIYTSGNDNGNLYFGLGKYIVSGTWQTITRDLEKDLHKYEPDNEIVSVNAFLIRGSGRIGKIEMLTPPKKKSIKKKSIEVDITPNNPKVETIVKKVEEKIKNIIRHEQREKEQEESINQIEKRDNKADTLVPKIILEEGSLLYHKLGEPFFDPGATAIDHNGVTLDVDTIGEVDINKVNRYVLTYIATDENGYTTTKARVVMVHKAGEEVKEKKKSIPKLKNIKKVNSEKKTNYEELLDLTPLDGADMSGGEIDEDLMYYD